MAEVFPMIFPFFFIGMWVLICIILSKMGGWGKLAEKYEYADHFDGNKWHFQSFSFGKVNYSSCATIGANLSHLYLSVLIFFRIGHPKLRIPYNDFTGKESKEFLLNCVIVNFKDMPELSLKLYKKQADRIEMASNGNWKYERK